MRARAAKAGIAVRFDRALSAEPAPEWSAEMDQMIVGGSQLHKEVVFFHRASAALILTDLMMNFERSLVFPWFRYIACMAKVLDPDGQMPLDMRVAFWRGRRVLRESVKRMLAWRPERVILAHGRRYQSNAVEELERAFRWALP